MAKITPSKASEKRYASDLRKIAKASSMLIMSHVDDWRFDSSALILLAKYAESLTPWASKTAEKMLRDTNSNSDRFFTAQMKSIGKEYNRQLAESVAGAKAKQLQNEQVELIKSIPIKAGMRAQELSQKAASGGRRADEVAKELLRTNEITEARAMLIARTEVAKANATFNQARAQAVGSESYVWRTAEDSDVRDTHAELNGKVFRWDNPPCIEGEGCHHPSEIWNCRCYAEPII
jgi:SPP1 gp7 family putative phage head morphogenesis protein